MYKFVFTFLLAATTASAQSIVADRIIFTSNVTIEGATSPPTMSTPWTPFSGGTGLSTVAAGDTLCGGPSIFTRVAAVATGSIYASNGTSTCALWTSSPSIAGTVTSQGLLPALASTYDIGSTTLPWRNAWIDQMYATLFVKSTQTLYGGWLAVSKNAGILGSAVTSGSTTIDFGNAMTANQFVVIRATDTGNTIREEYIKVVSLSSGTTYNVNRDLANVNPTNQGWNWPKGTPYQVRGVAGDQWIELNAITGGQMSLFTQGSAYNNSTENMRVGNLSGMPNSSSGIGFYIGDATNFMRYDSSTLKLVSSTVNIDANGMTLAPGTAFSNLNGYKWSSTPIGSSGQTGDQFSASGWLLTGPPDIREIDIYNTMVGQTLGGSTGEASIDIKATGWNTSAAYTPAEIFIVSNPATGGHSDVALTADNIKASSGLFERSRTTRMGDWASCSSPTLSSGGVGSFTVGTGSLTCEVSIVGHTATYRLNCEGCSVSGSPGVLEINGLPYTWDANVASEVVIPWNDGTWHTDGFSHTTPNATQVQVYRSGLAAWPTVTNAFLIRLIVIGRVQ